jgi:hypothetical protein
MLSILIPVYNFDVTNFVTDLHTLCKQEKIAFEIILFDDASNEDFKNKNRLLQKLPFVTYQELTQNIGRSAIRNKLAEAANYDFLMFVDCDSKINDSKFIYRYVKNLSPYTVLYGGRNYEKEPPKNSDYYLRWIYGVKRETISAEKRSEKPYSSFMTNNFIIPKKLFNSIKFEEKIINGYGHEDTLFGIELKKNRICVVHLENPLCHIGLETTDDFIAKTENGIKNLYTLYNNGLLDNSVKLIRIFEKLQQTKTTPFVANYFIKNQQKIKLKLYKKNNVLKWFDIYKIGYLCAVKHQLIK